MPPRPHPTSSRFKGTGQPCPQFHACITTHTNTPSDNSPETTTRHSSRIVMRPLAFRHIDHRIFISQKFNCNAAAQ